MKNIRKLLLVLIFFEIFLINIFFQVAEASIYPVGSGTLKSDSLEQKSTFIEIIGLYSCSSPNFSIRLDIKNINGNVIHTFQKSNSYSPGCQANSGWLRGGYTVTGNNCVKNYVNEDSLN